MASPRRWKSRPPEGAEKWPIVSPGPSSAPRARLRPSVATCLHTCMLCEAVCGLAVEVDGATIKSIRGDPDDPFSRGHICPKAAAIGDVQADPDRIREPQRREGDRWRPVSWKEALDEAGERLAAIQRKQGRSAV